MKGLVLKDLCNAGSSMKQFVFMMIFLSVCMISSIGAAGVITMCMVMGGILLITSFSYDEYSHWEGYALSMPVSRGDYVTAKYVTGGVFALAGGLLGLIISALIVMIIRIYVTLQTGIGFSAGVSKLKMLSDMGNLNGLLKFGADVLTRYSFSECIFSVGAGLLVIIACISVYVPLMIKFGANKGRLVMIVVMGAMFGSFFGIIKALGDSHFTLPPAALVLCAVAALAVLLAVSRKLALHWFRQKEF